jgi:hypothetical protein
MVSEGSMRGIPSPTYSDKTSNGTIDLNNILYNKKSNDVPKKIDFKNLDQDTKNIVLDLNNSISPPFPSVYPDGTLTAADSQAYQAGLRKKNLEKQKILNILKIVFIIGLIIGLIIGFLALLEHFDVLNVGLIPDKKSTFINTCMSAIK